jgi:hypothetical protein
MSVEMLAGIGAFVGLFVMFVVLPSRLRKRTPDQE